MAFGRDMNDTIDIASHSLAQIEITKVTNNKAAAVPVERAIHISNICRIRHLV